MPDSLIFGWEEGRVKEVLNNKLKSAAGAKTLTNCPLSLRALHPEILDKIATPILADHKQAYVLRGSAQGCMGESNFRNSNYHGGIRYAWSNSS